MFPRSWLVSSHPPGAFSDAQPTVNPHQNVTKDSKSLLFLQSLPFLQSLLFLHGSQATTTYFLREDIVG